MNSRFLVLAALTVFWGCRGDPTEPPLCTAEARAGITVEVVEGITGVPLAEGSVLTLREDPYVETVTESVDGRHMSGAWERAGLYEVRVDREGFAPWRTAEVEVLADVCHVQTVVMTAPIVELIRR